MSSNRDLLQVRVFERVPLYCSVLRVDDRYFVTPYLQSAAARTAPLLILEDKSLPWTSAYHNEFETVWETARDLWKADESPVGAIPIRFDFGSRSGLPCLRPNRQICTFDRRYLIP